MFAFCGMLEISCLAGRLLVLKLAQSKLLTLILEMPGHSRDSTILAALP
jgi:hypothetical protein